MDKSFTEDSVPDQSGRTILVTGANTGIGYEAARVLAERGARVLIGCRSAQRAEAARQRIMEKPVKGDVIFLPLDLASLESIRKAASQVRAGGRLDVLINNAGVMSIPERTETEDGFEMQFGINHLGHFALTGLLLDLLRSSQDARVVTVSSAAHRGGKIDFDDLQATKHYDRMERYGMSKLANALFTTELQRRLSAAGDSVLSLACHPGFAHSELSREFSGTIGLRLLKLFMPFQSAAGGALPTLRAAVDQDAKGAHYYGPSKRFQTVGPPIVAELAEVAHNPEMARILWERSIEATGIDPGLPPVRLEV